MRSVVRPLRRVGWSWVRSGFSEVADGGVPKVMEDWEYCKMITSELRNNNINAALSLLFQVLLPNRRATSTTAYSTSRSTTNCRKGSWRPPSPSPTQKSSTPSTGSTSLPTPSCTLSPIQVQLDE